MEQIIDPNGIWQRGPDFIYNLPIDQWPLATEVNKSKGLLPGEKPLHNSSAISDPKEPKSKCGPMDALEINHIEGSTETPLEKIVDLKRFKSAKKAEIVLGRCLQAIHKRFKNVGPLEPEFVAKAAHLLYKQEQAGMSRHNMKQVNPILSADGL